MVTGDLIASDITLDSVKNLIYNEKLLEMPRAQQVPPPQPGPHPSFISWYGLEICFALVFLILLWNVTLCCKIQYSPNTKVTKLTFLPYLFSCVFLVI